MHPTPTALERRAATRLATVDMDHPDARTALADCRTALALARGCTVDDIDPSTGHDLSERAHHAIRDQWAGILTRSPLSDYLQNAYRRAAAIWRTKRPDLAVDWPELPAA